MKEVAILFFFKKLYLHLIIRIYTWLWIVVEGTVGDDDRSDKFNKLDRDRTAPERKTKELDGYVGFANLPNQVYRKAVKKGFDFTLMVVGKIYNL